MRESDWSSDVCSSDLALSDLPVKVYAGADALSQIVESQPIDIVLASMVAYDLSWG